jgi:hypothetical protein
VKFSNTVDHRLRGWGAGEQRITLRALGVAPTAV